VNPVSGNHRSNFTMNAPRLISKKFQKSAIGGSRLFGPSASRHKHPTTIGMKPPSLPGHWPRSCQRLFVFRWTALFFFIRPPKTSSERASGPFRLSAGEKNTTPQTGGNRPRNRSWNWGGIWVVPRSIQESGRQLIKCVCRRKFTSQFHGARDSAVDGFPASSHGTRPHGDGFSPSGRKPRSPGGAFGLMFLRREMIETDHTVAPTDGAGGFRHPLWLRTDENGAGQLLSRWRLEPTSYRVSSLTACPRPGERAAPSIERPASTESRQPVRVRRPPELKATVIVPFLI